MMKAVMKIAPDQWHAIGLGMGYTIGQLDADTEGLPNHGSKLLKIIRQKAAEIGRGRTRQLLLEVRKRLPNPVIAAVMEELQKGGADKQEEH